MGKWPAVLITNQSSNFLKRALKRPSRSSICGGPSHSGQALLELWSTVSRAAKIAKTFPRSLNEKGPPCSLGRDNGCECSKKLFESLISGHAFIFGSCPAARSQFDHRQRTFGAISKRLYRGPRAALSAESKWTQQDRSGTRVVPGEGTKVRRRDPGFFHDPGLTWLEQSGLRKTSAGLLTGVGAVRITENWSAICVLLAVRKTESVIPLFATHVIAFEGFVFLDRQKWMLQ